MRHLAVTWGAGFILALSLIIWLPACQTSSSKRMQLEKVDSLTHDLDRAQEKMQINEDRIEKREVRIKKHLDYISRHYHQDTLGRMLQLRLTDYKGMGKAYESFIERYEAYQYENKAHRKRIADLRKDVVEGNLTNQQFQKIYREERKVLGEHLEEVSTLVRNITQLEPVYQRTVPKMRTLYQQIKKHREDQQPSKSSS